MDAKKELLASLKSSVLKTPAVIKAFEAVDRADFVPAELKAHAYIDEPLHIAYGQTISQPWTVAVMTEALGPEAGQKILEVGAGSGYQAAILSKIVGERGRVVTIEFLKELYEYAKTTLRGYKNVKLVLGDGSKGYAQEAPYDRIIVTAAAPSPFIGSVDSKALAEKPPAAKNAVSMLFEQLKEGGIIVIPVGGDPSKTESLKMRKYGSKMLYPANPYEQHMLKIRKAKGKMQVEDLGPFVFVPLKGEFGFED